MTESNEMLAVEASNTAFYYQSLARQSWVNKMPIDAKAKLKSLVRELRFEMYKELDDLMMTEVIKLSKQKRESNTKFTYEELFGEAAITVCTEWTQETN